MITSLHRRILAAAAGILLLAIFALPALAPQMPSADQPTPPLTSSAEPSHIPATDQISATAQMSATQQASATEQITQLPAIHQPTTDSQTISVSALRFGIGDQTCSLQMAANIQANQTTPESTAQSDLLTLMMGSDCQKVTPRLRVPDGGTLWMNLTVADEPDLWLKLNPVTCDAAPPQLDARGRYYGCAQAQLDEQLCEVTVAVGGMTYRVAIPLRPTTV